ncbi:MAG: asparagine synthase [Bacteroidales bacterium]|nr:asparagine synthase [Bacteroidales bacterium]
MVKIDLIYHCGFSWYRKDGISVKGYLFDTNDNYYTGETLFGYFRSVTGLQELKEKLETASGMFAVIICGKDFTLLASDIIRTFPLFYKYSNGNMQVSDSAHFLAETCHKSVNELRETEYLATGYTTGKNTLFSDIYQVQPGQIHFFSEREHKELLYYSFVTGNVYTMNYAGLKNRLHEIIESTFNRLIRSSAGRQIVIPLSGGYDSRLIASALKRKGFENIICITYGKRDRHEVTLSKRVAEKLGYRWIFVEHSPEVTGDYIHSEDFAGYHPYAANGTGFSYLFEYFGARYLKYNFKLPEGSVFIPGHSGDFLGGSQITKFGIAPEYSRRAIVKKLYRLKYNYITPGRKASRIFKREIAAYFAPFYEKQGRKYSYSFIEDWDYREKLSKTIANSSNVFSYFGFQYRLPFWDREIVEFFRKVPYQYKLKKKLYNEVLEEYYFKPYGLCFEDEMKVSGLTYRLQQIKTRLKSFLPYIIKKHSTLKVDWVNYHLITAPMAEQLKNAGLKYHIYDLPFNIVIMQWYLAKLKGQIP